MLYKKNSQKTLSKELFKNPTCEYRGTPFWSWNCDLNEGLLDRQIDALKEMGFGGFHMHSRSGMSMPYLGETFMNRIKFCVEKAKKENMLAWLYDEDRWPSGAAGGLVTKDKALRNKYIVFHPADIIKTDLPREEATKTGGIYFAVSYDIVQDENGCLISATRMPRDGKAEGQAWYGYVTPYPDNQAWYNGQAYVDTMDDEAIQKFIDITYESYKNAVGDDFDGVVPAIFTDEPQLFSMGDPRPKTPFSKDHILLPWSRYMQENYTEMYGGDIFDILPEVIWNLPDGKFSWKRHRFYDFCAERFCTAFADQCGDWCRKNGIAFTGHVNAEQTLEYQTRSMAEAMRPYRGFQIPGTDQLCNDQELTTAKQCQSAVHQFGKEAMLCELYGVTNYTFDFRGHKYQGDWLAALGVTVRVPHLSWVSMQGEAKRDYPASISYQSPWYKEYKYIEDHYARLNTALTRGKPAVNVGVIHPLESYWLARGPISQSADLCNNLEEKFANITSWLIEGHYDYNFIAESLLSSQQNDNPKAVGSMEYSVIIVPDCITLRSTTLEYLEKFKANGGEVIFLGDCPAYIDAVESNAAASLYENSVVIPFDKPQIFKVLKNFATVEINNTSGINADRFLYNMRIDGADRWLFIANRYQYNTEKWHKNPYGGFANNESLAITVKGEFFPVEYNTLNGEIVPVRFEHKNGNTIIYKKLYSSDSLLLKLCADSSELPGATVENDAEAKLSFEEQMKKFMAENYAVSENMAVDSGYTIKSKVNYRRHEPNVLLLDYFEMALDGDNYDVSDEVLKAYGAIRQKAGWNFAIGEQPWVIPNEAPSHFVNVKTVINSEIDYANPVLALELANISEITWNGEKVTAKPDGWYVDESIGTVQLPPLKKGENELIVKTPLSPRTNVEAMYLLGDFNVRLEGSIATIVPVTREIAFGSITGQGMPFYGGNVDYNIEIDLDKPTAVQIHAFKYAGALLGVSVDGVRVGNIIFEPYNFNTHILSAGKHTITLTCFGNRNNTFGALHWCSDFRRWYGPDAWRKWGDEWSYEYNVAPTGILVSPWINLLKD